ncbi:MAG: response regulator [Thermosynechococcaceae cyanobacterium]
MQASGEFVVQILSISPRQTWHIYFHLGRIVWAGSVHHRVRRWLRASRQNSPLLLNPDWSQARVDILASHQESKAGWEIQLLDRAIKESAISLAQAKAIVDTYIQEAIFHAIQQPSLKCQWNPSKELPLAFMWLDVDQVLQQANVLSAQWNSVVAEKSKDLPFSLSPDMVPTIDLPDILQQKVSPGAYQLLNKLLNGQRTFWDLALSMQKPVSQVIATLLPFIREDIIKVQDVPDLVFPDMPTPKVSLTTTRESTASAPADQGLIACIDDSPVIGKEIEAILQPLGYEILSILDPLQSISTLMQKKPKLIFLDLLMPNTNGYELCAFLRKSSAFRDIPIVMLTGQDGVIDRLKAKMVGSTDFLSKPPDPEKVQQVVQRLLRNHTTESPYIPNHEALRQVPTT